MTRRPIEVVYAARTKKLSGKVVCRVPHVSRFSKRGIPRSYHSCDSFFCGALLLRLSRKERRLRRLLPSARRRSGASGRVPRLPTPQTWGTLRFRISTPLQSYTSGETRDTPSMKPQLKQYRGPLSSSEIAEGMNVARQNAARLVKDARLLFDNKSYASAVALSILAI